VAVTFVGSIDNFIANALAAGLIERPSKALSSMAGAFGALAEDGVLSVFSAD